MATNQDDLEKHPSLPNTTNSVPHRRRSCLKISAVLATALAATFAGAILVFVAVVNPHKMKFHVTGATLKEFNLTAAAAAGGNATLRYDLRLNVAVRNPNKKIEFHYEVVESDTFYAGGKFGSGNRLSFYQPPKTTTVVSDTWYRGIATGTSLGRDEGKRLEEQKRSRVYPMVVKIRFYSSIKLGKMRIGDFKVKVKCGFRVPLKNSTNSSGNSVGFETTKCHVDFKPFIVIYND